MRATINYQSEGRLRTLWTIPAGVTTKESCIIAFAKDIIYLVEYEIKVFRSKCNVFYPDVKMFSFVKIICKKSKMWT